eukprot:TRINITY_DN190_c0_g1_i6.p1 TRINITY_DN190_c0_g1~~TRINITY_DN190_c0_g1_i6.p1  ORF type:complete len:743 (+),score=169.21 TRINITY_DN190_c0_g1_i6:247-2475(+)
MQSMVRKSPTFQYWDTILRIELLGLTFVRAHRERDFPLYVESMKALAPWFFALDHHNYARWVPIHIRDMESLPPTIEEEFIIRGNWVVQKTARRFSSIPIDQAHEQNNELVKGPGGAVGLTENPTAFKKWMIAGPEQARILTEFEREYTAISEEERQHHEEGLSAQKTFHEQTLGLIQVINEMSNPFLEEGSELIALDTRRVIGESVANTVQTIEEVGQAQYDSYNEAIITERRKSIHEPVKRNSLPLFRSSSKGKRKQSDGVSLLKDDVSLFSRLYIVAQNRDTDMGTFFQHENHPHPPSLSERGTLRQGKKSDLIGILVEETQNSQKEPPPFLDARILDGAAVVYLLPLTNVTTFNDYANEVFIPHILKLLESCRRVDVVWDSYIASSIKESTREKRGKGVRRKVGGPTKVPSNWPDFLRDPTNKEELFQFLSDKVGSSDWPDGKGVFITSGTNVISRGSDHSMPRCDHEEADTRIVVHLKDALDKGCTNCLVRTVDTDVVAILIGKYHSLTSQHQMAAIWVAFGTGKNFMYLDINAICHALGKDRSTALPIFHSFTGCDTTSAFFGKGKKSAWEAWNAYVEVTEAFNNFMNHPYMTVTVNCKQFQLLERFTVIIYNKTSNLDSVNEARRELFSQKNRPMEKIPPTQEALLQHTLRAVYQAGIWATSDQCEQKPPTPEGFGWTLESATKTWRPVWSNLPVASQACSELVKCGCKSATCGGRCSCKKAQWKCTELCSCQCE